jgi:hypothetical protein
MSEHLIYFPFPHRGHRDAIGKTVSLISAGAVKRKTTQKRFSRLGHDQDALMAHRLFEHPGNRAAFPFASSREIVEELNQNFVSRQHGRIWIRLAECCRLCMPSISGIRQSNPVKLSAKISATIDS